MKTSKLNHMKKFLFLTLLVISSLLHAENWTGTGWALKKGYIVTNFHCVDGAKSIIVETTEDHYSAKVVATDSSSDLAIIKIDDDKFSGFGEIPYSIERQQCEVGETVWTLGFPMTSIMGAEVKFTDGKISAKTGYMGDLSTYQITVPIHPGNSGGPLFNKNGNIVGITSSGLDKQLADNVNYAIKANYLLNLIESALSVEIIPNGSVKNLALTEYVRRNKKYVFLLHFSTKLPKNIIAESNTETRIESYPQEPQQNPTPVELFEYVQIAEDKLEIKKYIGEWREISIPSTVTQNGRKYTITQIGDKAFANCKHLTQVKIANTIVNVGNAAFENCTSLISIDVPNSVVTINSQAFKGCSSLKSVSLSNNLTTIEPETFKGCSALTFINIPKGLTSIGSSAFYDCKSLGHIDIPFGIKEIRNVSFANCSSLKSINLPNSVEKIGEFAFKGCSSLSSLYIPNSVDSIGKRAFEHCFSLDSIVLPNSVTQMGSGVFAYCGALKIVKLPDNITSLDCDCPSWCANCHDGFFIGCSSLQSIVIPKNVSKIDKYTFSGCSSLKSVVMHSNIIEIDVCAFEGCSSLQSITLPDSITTIRKEAFKNCKSLKSITIPINLSLIEEKAFEGCSSLTSVIWNAKKASTTIIKIPQTPHSYTTRVASPFYDILSQIKSITFGDNVEYIPSCLCLGMNNLHYVSISNSVKKIDSDAFRSCSSLTNITIPNNVKEIGNRAFYYCSSLANITISNNVEAIGYDALAGLSDNAQVTILGKINSFDNAFGYGRNSLILCVPYEFLKYYKAGRRKMAPRKKIIYKTF